MSAWERHKAKACDAAVCRYCLYPGPQHHWTLYNPVGFAGVNRAMCKDLKARQNDQDKIVRVRKV